MDFNKELLHNIQEACKIGLSEREIKQQFNLSDWDYKQARKILSNWGGDYE